MSLYNDYNVNRSEVNFFSLPSVDPGEVTFKVEKNKKGLEAKDVAKKVGEYLQNYDKNGRGSHVVSPITQKLGVTS